MLPLQWSLYPFLFMLQLSYILHLHTWKTSQKCLIFVFNCQAYFLEPNRRIIVYYIKHLSISFPHKGLFHITPAPFLPAASLLASPTRKPGFPIAMRQVLLLDLLLNYQDLQLGVIKGVISACESIMSCVKETFFSFGGSNNWIRHKCSQLTPRGCLHQMILAPESHPGLRKGESEKLILEQLPLIYMNTSINRSLCSSDMLQALLSQKHLSLHTYMCTCTHMSISLLNNTDNIHVFSWPQSQQSVCSSCEY